MSGLAASLGTSVPKDKNAELIEKTIATSDFLNGGALNAAQQERFVVFVKQFSVMLDEVRFVRMTQSSQEIDKLHVGEPVTVSADENTAATVFQKPKFGKVELLARKVRSDWNITTESLQDNIEQDNFEETVMNAFGIQMATDFENLAWNGDSSITGTEPLDLLLKRLDGWRKLADSAHILDAGGNAINKEIFHEAKRALPKQFRNDRELRWFMSPTIADDWLNILAERATPLGDRALAGEGVNPAGIPIMRTPVLPDDLGLDILAATPAQVLGTRQGPFEIVTGTNDGLDIKVNGGGTVSVTLPAGTLLAVEVVKEINDALTTAGEPAVAIDNGDGQVLIATTETGATKSIEVEATGSANATLGFPAAGTGVVSGSDSGTTGEVFEGSEIILCNPRNLVWGILDGTRMFSEFNKNFDRIETTAFNQVAAQIENLDALVKITNVRRSSSVSAV